MNTFSNLKIISHKVLDECLMEILAKINIICGKNNSGKTTLLETINQKEKIIIGEWVSDEMISSFQNAWNDTSQTIDFIWNGGRQKFSSYFRIFDPTKIIFEIFNEKRIWYSVEFSIFLESFIEIIKTNIENSSRKDIDDVYLHHLRKENTLDAWKKGFLAIFEKSFSKLFLRHIGNIGLVSPKRKILYPSSVANTKTVDSEGNNIISKLFDLRNKLNGTSENILYGKISETFRKVSDGYNFDIELEDGNLSLFFSRIEKGNWISARDCGLGLQDLLIIIYFALDDEYSVILLEEPENHIHPEMQRRLMRFLSEETEKQYFITTHSNIFLNTTYASRIFFTSFENNKVNVSDATKRTEILNELGYSISDNLVSDLIVLVEGPTDTPIIEEYLKKFGIDANYNIKTWALGGDIMAQLDLTVFSERYKVIALIDKDPKSAKIRNKFVTKCKDLDIPVTKLQRYAIENYFSVRALKEVFKGQIPTNLTDIDPDKSLEEQININVKNNNRKLAQVMTIEEIEGTDLHKFFQKVEKLCAS